VQDGSVRVNTCDVYPVDGDVRLNIGGVYPVDRVVRLHIGNVYPYTADVYLHNASVYPYNADVEPYNAGIQPLDAVRNVDIAGFNAVAAMVCALATHLRSQVLCGSVAFAVYCCCISKNRG
jgi:hypothetical protein